jgi:hypothetical protein
LFATAKNDLVDFRLDAGVSFTTFGKESGDQRNRCEDV